MSNAERGRAAKIGEGRKSNSRSSSRSSDMSPRINRRPPTPNSDNEPGTSTLTAPETNEQASGSGTDANAPLVRPAISKWGAGLVATPFGTFNNSSNFYRTLSGQASTSVERDVSGFGVNPTMNIGALNLPSAPLPSAVHAHSKQRSVSDTSSEGSYAGPTSLRSSELHAAPVPMSLHDFASPQSLTIDNAMPLQTPTLPTKVNIPMAMQPILPTKVNISRNFSAPGVQQTSRTISSPMNGVHPSTEQAPVAVSPIKEPILPTKITFSGSSSSVSNHYRNDPDPVTTIPNRTYYRNQKPGNSTRVPSNSSDVSAAGCTSTPALEPPRGTTSQKGRARKKSAKSNNAPSSPQRKKRGDWRVKDYSVDPSAIPAPEPAAKQQQNSGRHKSAFKAHGYQNNSSIIPPALDPVAVVDVTNHSYDMHSNVVGIDEHTFIENASEPIHNVQTTNVVEQLYAEERQSNTMPSSPATHMENSFSETLVSRGSSNSIPPSLNNVDPELPTRDGGVESLGDLGPPAAQIHQVPTVRLVSVVIEDNRYSDTDEQLVEMKLLLKPAKDGFWADANDVCGQLQQGPSRIDGPAKVYAYRGKYRQYFLRISSDNKDNFASANLSVNANRVLRIYAEAGPNQPMPSVVHTTPQLASPAPSSSSDTYGVRPSLLSKRPLEPHAPQMEQRQYSTSPGPWHPQSQNYPNKRHRYGSSDPQAFD